MEKLNIAFYTDVYLPAVDGVVTSLLNFKKGLEKRGHRVYIFSSCSSSKLIKKYSSKRVFLYPGRKFKPYPQYSVALFPYYSALQLRDLDIDLIHAQTPLIMGFTALLTSRLGKYPLAGSFHTMINSNSLSAYYPKNKSFKKFAKKYLWLYTKYFYRRCDVTIAPTRTIESMLKKQKINDTAIVPNSIDPSVYNSRVNGNGIRKELKISENEKMVLYVGRLSKEKKIDTLLKAAKRITKKNEKVKFIIGGTGPATDYYKNIARYLGIQRHVKFIGFVDTNVLPKLYAASDLLCLPSTFETQGIVSLEAMATGKPVVGADFLALKEIIKNGKNGEKFAPGDYIQCAQKIEKVLNNSDSYKKSAVDTAKEFTIDRTTDKLLNVYNLLLSEHGRFADR